MLGRWARESSRTDAKERRSAFVQRRDFHARLPVLTQDHSDGPRLAAVLDIFLDGAASAVDHLFDLDPAVGAPNRGRLSQII